MNRRIRNRTYGGVGGGPKMPSYPIKTPRGYPAFRGFSLSNVQIGNAQCIFLDEFAARFHLVAHKAREE